MKSHWITYFEKSGCLDSPRYSESIRYFKQFAERTPYAKMFSIGVSPQGRSIECLVISKGNEFTPEKAKKSGKAIVLIQNGIHAGEIEGKDASMLLLRDLIVTKEKFHLLDHLILLVIPVLSVDGHERFSSFNRPNQNGPATMGWRTNSWNLNLNRDYMKADTPEIRAFLQLFNTWLPDFFIDNHTTNGADYQYHISYALESNGNIDRGLAEWANNKFITSVLSDVEARGFLTAPYIELRNDTVESGIIQTPSLPRLSTGYTAVQNRIGLLVETHSLKPYKNRVRSTYAMNEAALTFLHGHSQELKRINQKADDHSSAIKSVPIIFTLTDKSQPFEFKGFASEYVASPVTGDNIVQYSEEPINFVIPFYNDVLVSKKVRVPKAYIIPEEFSFLVHVLEMHGIHVDRLQTNKLLNVEQYVFDEFTFSQKPYEGRLNVAVSCNSIKQTKRFPKRAYIVDTGQRTRRVIVNLLEPEAPDSFVSWGFFNAFFERKEYAEPYVMEPIARQMLAANKQLQREFLELLDNDIFRDDPKARLDYFYKRSPYFDIYEKKYPVFRLIS